MAHPIPAQHRHGRGRAVDSARYPRDPGVPSRARRKPRGTRSDDRGVSTAAEGNCTDRPAAPGGAVARLYLNAFIFTYGTQVLGASRDLLLTGLIVTTGLGSVWAPIDGALSESI